MGIRLVVRTKTSEPDGDRVVLEFDQARVALGRGGGADVPLPHVSVSSLHATIRTHNAGYALFDESSTNGTRVADAKLAPGRAKTLRSGDVVAIGPFRIEVHVGVPVTRSASVEDSLASARRLASPSQGSRRRVASLTLQNGPRAGEVVPIDRSRALLLGSGADCDVVLDDGECAPEHCRVEVDELGVLVREVEGGVFVNERPGGERRLRDRDELRIGHTVLVYDDPLEHDLEDIRAAADALYDDSDITPAPVPDLPRDAHDAPRAPAVAEFSDTDVPAFSSLLPAPPRAQTSRGTVEGLVYGLAGVVLVLSIVAMYFLLRAG